MSPSIPPEFRASLIGPTGLTCSVCQQPRIKHYCRTCDEFLVACRCTDDDSAHHGHRMYIWTPTGIVAEPNFDDLVTFVQRGQAAQAAVDEVLDRPNTDAEVRALYESMTTAELRLLGRALELDARHGAVHAFVVHRLRLIEEVLQAREPKA